MDPARNPAAAKYIAEGPHLDIYCYGGLGGRRCDRTVTLTAAQIEATIGPVEQVNLARLNRTLVCSHCGARARDKKVQARWSVFEHYINAHRARIAAEVAKWGEPQTCPLVLPGIGPFHPEDMGLVVPPRPSR